MANTPFVIHSSELNTKESLEDRVSLEDKLRAAQSIREWEKAIFEAKLSFNDGFDVYIVEEGEIELLLDSVLDDFDAQWAELPDEMALLLSRHDKSKEFLEDLWNRRIHLQNNDPDWQLDSIEYGAFNYEECIKGATKP